MKSATISATGVPAVGALVLLAACAPVTDEASGSGVVANGPLYETVATVLEGPDGGPFLCHAVDASLPPQCGGPEIVGWDWSQVTAETAADTTWGDYFLVGSWDGQRFHLAEPARLPEKADLKHLRTEESDFTTPCPEPEGGWTPVDPGTTTEEAMQEAMARARSAPDYAGSWLDQSYLDDIGGGGDSTDADLADREQAANDPARLVLNLRFTGDLAEREQDIREVWGGALCLTGAEHTERELLDIQQQLHADLDDVTSSGIDVRANAVTVQVLVATVALQADLDQRYGAGTVSVVGLLQPRS